MCLSTKFLWISDLQLTNIKIIQENIQLLALIQCLIVSSILNWMRNKTFLILFE